ncbi:cuticle protein AMP1A-like [Penaeus japonicus]|uniref:cuticle protein AMP1A-like n=1 Tax=Penaeus japonicus TaxID=27405 RepID=UPI001C713B70|nr:cuticle protein AMP1A-like [Penaeus japonicus]
MSLSPVYKLRCNYRHHHTPTMKLIIFACLAAVALARPQAPESEAETLLDERSDNGDGNFQYTFETSNGIRANKVGTPGSEGQSNMEGSFR